MSKKVAASSIWRRCGRWLASCALVFVAAHTLQAQAPAPEKQAPPAGPPVTVRGVVLNAATGQPLWRALVQIDVEPKQGALTDRQGAFEIRNIPSGTQKFLVTKPGFEDSIESDAEPGRESGQGSSHLVRVGAGMPDLSFSLAPNGAIFGHITLSTGFPAQGIGVNLMRRTIADGRANWNQEAQNVATPDGAFRFSGLSDGTYLLATRPELENDSLEEPSCSADAPAELSGFAVQFYNGASKYEDATPIVMEGGHSADVNLALTLTRLHLVQATLAGPPLGAGWVVTHTLHDRAGQTVDYVVHDNNDHSMCAYLPDGSYTLVASASLGADREGPLAPAAGKVTVPTEQQGSLDFAVDGNAMRDLKVPLAPGASTNVILRYEPKPPPPIKRDTQSGDLDKSMRDEQAEAEPLFLGATPIHAAVERNEGGVAYATVDTTLTLETLAPGEYQIHSLTRRDDTCLGKVTAGGENLARVPWVAGSTGAGPPIEVVLRTDCAALTVEMPPAFPPDGLGEGVTAFIYLLPDFDSLQQIPETRVDQFGERIATIKSLTPGAYRVFAFRTPRSIEFRNPAALERLGPGQKITLEPGGSAKVVLEGISK